MSMRTDDFDYNLPEELIAQAPAEPRDSCRLLVVDRKGSQAGTPLEHGGTVEHRIFRDIIDYIEPGDVHLMIEDPDRWAPEYAKLGAASVSFHMGATHAPVRLARQLREMGCKACFAVRPAEPVEPIFDILDEFDMVLIMTVEPGFGGQKFLDNQMAKVRRLRDEITRRGWRALPPRCRNGVITR